MDNKNLNNNDINPILSRLDILIKLLLIQNFSDENKNLKIGETVKFLYTNGWKTNEIVKFMGKKKASDISYIIHSVNKKQKKG